MQVLSAPSNARTFLFVNTAGAVPGEASVARNIARSRSLRKPGFLASVASYRFSNRGPPGVTSGLVMYVMLPKGYLHHGLDEQIFGADEQISAGLVQKMHSVSKLNDGCKQEAF